MLCGVGDFAVLCEKSAHERGLVAMTMPPLLMALALALVLVEVLVLVLKLVAVLVLGYRHVLSLVGHTKVLLFAAAQEHGIAALGPSACRSLVLVLGAASSSLAPV